MKLNLTVDLLMTTFTLILSILVFVDHCSARLRPMSSTRTSLSKFGNLAADHLSALQKTSRKVTKSSVVGINWKNVLLLAGLKAGLVGAKIVKKKIIYKKLKGLKTIDGLNGAYSLTGYPLNTLNGVYSFYDQPQPQLNDFYNQDSRANRFIPYTSFYPDQNFVQQTHSTPSNDWSKLPTPRSIESFSPVIWRKSSCTDLNRRCSDYLTPSSITYQLLGTPTLPLHPLIILPAASTATLTSATKISTSAQSNQPYSLTWVKNPSISKTSSISNKDDNESNNEISNSNGQNTNSNLSISSISAIKQQQQEQNLIHQISNFILQEKEDDKNHQIDDFNSSSSNYTQNLNEQTNQYKDTIHFKDPLQLNTETPSDQKIENSNKISTWSV